MAVSMPRLYRRRNRGDAMARKNQLRRSKMAASWSITPGGSKLVCKGVQPIPDIYVCTMKYVYQGSYAPPTGAISRNVWRANSIFDPDFTGAGAQPRYFDQLNAMYNTFQVISCRVVHQLVNNSTIPIRVGTTFTDSDPSAFTMLGVQESKFGKCHKILGTAGGDNTMTVKRSITTAKLHGYRSIEDVENLQGSGTADPTDPSFHMIAIQAADVSTAVSCHIDTTIYYRVKWFSPVNVAQST